MYRHILVPVDGSALSEYAIPFGIEIARRSGGRVKLMRAMSVSVEAPANLPPTVRQAAQEQVDGLLREWGGAEVPIVAEVRAGAPVDEILHADRRSDLIVMTVHGGGGIVRWVMGSTANKVIQLARTPVLAIHPPDKFTRAMAEASALRMFRDALVAFDGSPLFRLSLAELRQFAEVGTRLHLVQVVADEAAVKAAEETLAEHAARFEARGISVVQAVLRNASPSTALVEYAAQHGCGVIVMTTRGEGGLKRWLPGGTTDKVVRHGPTPVLVIRADAAEEAAGRRPLGA